MLVYIKFRHQMKELLSPLFETIPFLVEYLSTVVEEAEIDLLQARKCCDFKRMMLAAVEEGGGVGVPVPIGYDDIQVLFYCILYSHLLDRQMTQ